MLNKQTDPVAIVGAARTPIGSFGGAYQNYSAIQLGQIAIQEAIRRAGLEPEQVEEVVMGNVLQAGLGQNPARQAALAAGLPVESRAMTINHVCGSGLSAVGIAANAIRCGDSEIIVAGGMENMSMAPYLLLQARTGYRMGHQTVLDSMMHDGLRCAIHDYAMGITAEQLCERYGFTREQLDEYAWQSQMKAKEAAQAGRFNEEIIPVGIPQRKGDPLMIRADEYPRPDTTLEALARLRPAFRPDGIVTAGNASGINDGAAALVLMPKSRAAQLGLQPLAHIHAHATAGVEPGLMGLGPIPATERVLQRAGMALHEIDLIEVNEAFAAQALAYLHHIEVDPARFNVNGGAIALGHPIGASGARVLITLIHELRRRQARYGLAALCIGGGQGVAMIIENQT